MTKRELQLEEYSAELYAGKPDTLSLGKDIDQFALIDHNVVAAEVSLCGTHRIKISASMDMGPTDARALADWLVRAAAWVEATS